ncbi:MAG TPA: hypothetical protein PK747_10230 [Acidobacteriota bacterium]|nr:hypothetical protein [Acidobacteriota bacterium]HQQ47767.1 hypothetical protein [Acidobacteriota bacterium]
MKAKAIIVFVVFLFSQLCLMVAYEDNTHKSLTTRALEIAKDSIGELYSNNELRTAVIAGAGSQDGEDYTTYDIDWKTAKCEIEKTKLKYIPASTTEPLNHFKSGILSGGPAKDKFEKFWDDAVKLWKKGNKSDAAFILGRACHLIEDMAQPQHAMDESHCNKNYLGAPIENISFLEEFTEAPFNSATGFCPNSYFNYLSKINSVSVVIMIPEGDPVENLKYMQIAGEEAGFAYLNDGAFNTELINKLFDPPPIISGDLCTRSATICKCKDFATPFQYSNPQCGLKPYYYTRSEGNSGTEFGIQGDYTTSLADCLFKGKSNTARAVRVDLAMKLNQARLDEITPGTFGQEHYNKLLKPAIGYTAGVIVAFWNEVKDPKPCGSNGGLLSEDSGICPTCGGPPVIPTPAGDMPDDSVFVKSSTVESGQNPKTRK